MRVKAGLLGSQGPWSSHIQPCKDGAARESLCVKSAKVRRSPLYVRRVMVFSHIRESPGFWTVQQTQIAFICRFLVRLTLIGWDGPFFSTGYENGAFLICCLTGVVSRRTVIQQDRRRVVRRFQGGNCKHLQNTLGVR